jgi:peptide-methionine (S)-S-oxide reductase
MWNLFASRPTELIDPAQTLVGRPNPLPLVKTHAVLGNDMTAEPETGQSLVVVAMGCYWGAEKTFWKLDGVVTTAVGFAGGQTPNPTYRESCGGQTNHAESVRIVFDTTKISLKDVLAKFWESHDPTQVMRQGMTSELNIAARFLSVTKLIWSWLSKPAMTINSASAPPDTVR